MALAAIGPPKIEKMLRRSRVVLTRHCHDATPVPPIKHEPANKFLVFASRILRFFGAPGGEQLRPGKTIPDNLRYFNSATSEQQSTERCRYTWKA